MFQYHYEERLLTVEGLNLTIGDVPILRDINLHIDNVVRPGVHQGQVVCILGPSGIGKTQLFRCLAGLQRPTSGKVALNQEQTPVKAGQVGVVFQNYPLMNHRTVKQNLDIAATNAGKSADEIMNLLTMFNLQDKVNCFPMQLSGGQRQRISIIQQLLCSDHFVLMDEPFSGLDVNSKQKMVDLILKVSSVDELSTMIVTTHDIETAITIADHIWVLGRQKAQDGSWIPGSTIVKTVDLIARDLAWHQDIRHEPNFRPTCDELYNYFKSI